ncbi:pentatricopeptide repeat-containing protein At3g26630, chloroplastic-like [Zingiber officinale]|uniref:pentatricopeptide repeat-containing protein At3g26630, chloroplastic-like n=1 Tax=Zingiber officinale TaxID=94328 RepID=UPI001C4BA777|nr:pentatricopeptide repeat-containing protein At3g26630, chloroplastic-like [Zingiber officinale]
MSARNLFFGKDLLSQISKFYHELKRMAVGSKTPVEEEAEKEVNNMAESPQQDSKLLIPIKLKIVIEKSAFPKDARANPLTPQRFPSPRGIKNGKERAVLQEGCSNVSVAGDSGGITIDLLWFLKPCSTLEGKMVHATFVKHFPDCDAFVVNSLIDRHEKEVVSWTTIIGGLVKSRFVDDALKLFNEMPVRNVVSWTSLIVDHAKDGRASKAIGVLKEMMFENVEPDTVAMVVVLSACVQLQDLKLGKWLQQIVIDKRIGVNNNLANALINMYVKGGSIKSARHIFDSMNNKITPAWNAIIDGVLVNLMQTQCGFYVMKFMREIIEGNATSKKDSLFSMFMKIINSNEEIDEVRSE